MDFKNCPVLTGYFKKFVIGGGEGIEMRLICDASMRLVVNQLEENRVYTIALSDTGMSLDQPHRKPGRPKKENESG